MRFIEWTDELSIGIKKIDAEHKNLTVLANFLCEEIKFDDNHYMAQKAFNNFSTYTIPSK